MILVRQSIDEALSLVILTGKNRDMSKSDLEKIVDSYSVMESAKDSLLDGAITVDEYCDLCASHDINVDSYLEAVENELVTIGFG